MLISRRQALGLAAAGAGTQLLALDPLRAARSLTGRSVVFASWGGVYQNAQREAYCVPFERETGVRVIQDGPVSTARLRVMLDSGHINWDVVVANPPILMNLGDRLERVDTSRVDVRRIDTRFRWEHGVGIDADSMVLAHSADAFAGRRAPHMWEDLFDLKAFPGRRMLPADPRFTLEMALLADGVPKGALYPLDLDRAIRKLDTIKDRVIFYQSSSHGQQLIVDGIVSCGIMFYSRVFACLKGGAKIGVSWNDNLRDVTPIIVPQGGLNQDIAWSLVNACLVPENQARLANEQSIAPTNLDALRLIRPEIRSGLATSPENLERGVAVNPQYWGKNLAAINKRWQLWKIS